MKKERYDLWEAGEYEYEAAFGFVPNLHGYVHDEDSVQRPCMVIVPGGGYRAVSPLEGESMAELFYGMGYNAFVCTYTTDPLHLCPLGLQPLRDLTRAVRLVRKNARRFCIRPEQVIVCGFSAGGHLAGSLCVHWEDMEDGNQEYADVSCRPDAGILAYSVVSSREYAHKDSFSALYGDNAPEEQLEYMSLEKQVTGKTPPIFLWHTVADEMVPVENSILMAGALKEKGVCHELHLFARGKHGLSRADEAWRTGKTSVGRYTFEQLAATGKALREGRIEDSTGMAVLLTGMADADEGQLAAAAGTHEANPGAAMWPMLFEAWFRGLTGQENQSSGL